MSHERIAYCRHCGKEIGRIQHRFEQKPVYRPPTWFWVYLIVVLGWLVWMGSK